MQICLWTLPGIAFALQLSCWAVLCRARERGLVCAPLRKAWLGLGELLACSCVCSGLWLGQGETKNSRALPFPYTHCVQRGESLRNPWKKMGIPVLSACGTGSPLAWCHTCHVLSHLCPSGLAEGLWGLNLLCLDTVAHSSAAEPGWP